MLTVGCLVKQKVIFKLIFDDKNAELGELQSRKEQACGIWGTE